MCDKQHRLLEKLKTDGMLGLADVLSLVSLVRNENVDEIAATTIESAGIKLQLEILEDKVKVLTSMNLTLTELISEVFPERMD